MTTLQRPDEDIRSYLIRVRLHFAALVRADLQHRWSGPTPQDEADITVRPCDERERATAEVDGYLARRPRYWEGGIAMPVIPEWVIYPVRWRARHRCEDCGGA